MKKLAICALVLGLAAFAVPKSHAAQQCIHFTNFCDSIEIEQQTVNGEFGIVYWGDWDWECTGDPNDTNIIGTNKAPALAQKKFALGTRPVDSSSGTDIPFAYSAMFVFNKVDHLFDLYGTLGDTDEGGGSAIPFQLAQPWTVTKGSCGYAAPNGKPRLLANRPIKTN